MSFKCTVSFIDFAHRLTIEDLATRDNVINVPVALPTGYVVNSRPSQTIGDRVDVNKDSSNNKEVRTSDTKLLTTKARILRH